MSDQQGDDGGEWRKPLPGLSGSDHPLSTSKQIKNATVDELRQDERLWVAYERGWCDLLQSYMDMQLMQSETSYMLPEIGRPGLLASAATGASDPESVSDDAVKVSDTASEASVSDELGSSDAVNEVFDNGKSKPIDVRALASRIKRTYKYADVRLCEFQGLGPRTMPVPPKLHECPQPGEDLDPDVAEMLSGIKIKITSPEATDFELARKYEAGDKKPNTDDDDEDVVDDVDISDDDDNGGEDQ